MLHHFTTSIADTPLPERFTYPFCYTPHPLCVQAAREVQSYLNTRHEWSEELQQGKMFGVLVVQTQEGEIGYLAAFSGILAGKNIHPFFVPPVYDLLQPQGFFKIEEEKISQINARIKHLEEEEEYQNLIVELSTLEQAARDALNSARQQMKLAKEKREERRKSSPLSLEEEAELIRESQFQKAEYKREERAWKEKISSLQALIITHRTNIQQLKTERKTRSAALQHKLFEQFKMMNRRGESKTLCEIFEQTVQKMPPAGAGECAAPKLLQTAYLHNWKPIAMAEFWWGDSPKTEIRCHGHYYPACKGKCEPILKHMLQGLEVDENPILSMQNTNKELEIIYEDQWLVVINKPAGMLSVPGKENTASVYSLMREKYPEADGPMIVHRLDMATSGLLVIAKTKQVHQHLQAQFKNRTIQKRYIALLEGIVPQEKGTIELPLCLDPLDRPRQMVHPDYGKPAITDYQVLARTENRTHIAFFPRTGRTHQLRVHAAHPLGLHCPIVGDELYGEKAERLYLHAESLEFVHPITSEKIRLTKDANFLRIATKQDITSLHRVFEASVRHTCNQHYTEAQINAWITRADINRWQELFNSDLVFILTEDDATRQIAGFTSINAKGYLHSMFVHPDYQHKGIAQLLLDYAEQFAIQNHAPDIHVEASITARPFFEKAGYKVVKVQTVTVNGIEMTNFVMKKLL